MIPVKKIEVHKAEGRHDDPDLGRVITLRTFADVRALFRRWQNEPDLRHRQDRSYVKVDCRVTWADGTTRTIRFDLQSRTHMPNPCLRDDLMRELRFWSGDYCPPHMKREAYDKFIAQHTDKSSRASHRSFVARYDLENAR